MRRENLFRVLKFLGIRVSFKRKGRAKVKRENVARIECGGLYRKYVALFMYYCNQVASDLRR